MLALMMVLVGCGAPDQEAYSRGIESLRAGQSQQAVEAFIDALEQGSIDPSVYHGLGNALYRLNKPGPAIAAWRRGLALEPRNGDIAANLVHASKELRDRIEPPQRHRSAFFWQSMLSPLETAMAASGAVSVGLWWLVLGRIRPELRPSRLVLGGVTVTALILTASTIDTMERGTGAVIVAGEVDVRSTLGPSGVTLFALHEGATVTVADQTQTHALVMLTDGRKGWLNRRAIISTSPSEPFALPDG